MKNATLPPSDFVSKIIEPPIKRNQGVFCCSAFTGEGGICREAPKNADFPSSQFRGSFLSSNLELFLVWAIVLCGVDVSFLCSWELKQINFWTIENWLHHFKLRHFITSNRWYLSHYAWCHRGFARWHLFNHHFYHSHTETVDGKDPAPPYKNPQESSCIVSICELVVSTHAKNRRNGSCFPNRRIKLYFTPFKRCEIWSQQKHTHLFSFWASHCPWIQPFAVQPYLIAVPRRHKNICLDRGMKWTLPKKNMLCTWNHHIIPKPEDRIIWIWAGFPRGRFFFQTVQHDCVKMRSSKRSTRPPGDFF